MSKTQQGRLLRPIKLGVCAFMVAAGVAAMPARVHSDSATPMRFGIDMESLDRARGKDLNFAYGVFWVGSWTQKQGWNHTESELRTARSRSVTPVINWWYWGDDISPSCIRDGCRDARQGISKDLAT